MEKVLVFLASVLGIVFSQAPAVPQPPMCLMECMSEWFPCELDCRNEFPPEDPAMVTAFQECALPCEQERAACMIGASDPACNNNTANNMAHLAFQVNLTPTTPAPTTTTAAPTTTTTVAPAPAVPAAPVAQQVPANSGPVAQPGPAKGAPLATNPSQPPKAPAQRPVFNVAPPPRQQMGPSPSVSGPQPQPPKPRVVPQRNIFSGAPPPMSFPKPVPNNLNSPQPARNQLRFSRPMPVANQVPSNVGPQPVQQTVQRAVQQNLQKPMQQNLQQPVQQQVKQPVQQTVPQQRQQALQKPVQQTVPQQRQQAPQKPVQQVVQPMQQAQQKPVQRVVQPMQQAPQKPMQQVVQPMQQALQNPTQVPNNLYDFLKSKHVQVHKLSFSLKNQGTGK
ncbi:uncharacterized protein LOC133203858 isoform X2 [Saccostrea echinata]|uniref:uncharacterized protein LOC133203858 isoform X2 n=1 Tax=Saccostrea echinata TaxID=191078 RepID=UPI002A834F04|nr:uncharacterized protein LOC133203858 isoform X2 [Saccostrea echinata]